MLLRYLWSELPQCHGVIHTLNIIIMLYYVSLTHPLRTISNRILIWFFMPSHKLILDTAVLCHNRTSAEDWTGNQKLKGVELHLVSCYVTEIFY